MSGQRQLLSLGYESCGCWIFVVEPAALGESINRKLTRLLRQSLSIYDVQTQHDQPSHDVTNETLHMSFRMPKDPFLSVRLKTTLGNNTKAIYIKTEACTRVLRVST